MFLDLPLVSDPQDLMEGKGLLRWDYSNGSRIGIIQRYGNSSEMIWFDIEDCYCFYIANAWEDGDEVVLVGARYEKTDIIDLSVYIDDPENLGYLYEWRFNLKTSNVTERLLDGMHACDFTRINDDYEVKKTPYAYAIQWSEKFSFKSKAAIKYDYQSGQTSCYPFGPERYGGEMVFAPRDGATGEDDGYLINFVHDENSGQSESLLLDAQRIKDGPIARVLILQRVPTDFVWAGFRRRVSWQTAVKRCQVRPSV